MSIMDRIKRLSDAKGIPDPTDSREEAATSEDTSPKKMEEFGAAEDPVISPDFEDEVIVPVDDPVISEESGKKEESSNEEEQSTDWKLEDIKPNESSEEEKSSEWKLEDIKTDPPQEDQEAQSAGSQGTQIVEYGSFMEQISTDNVTALSVETVATVAPFEKESFLTNVMGTSQEVNVITLSGDPELELKPEQVQDTTGRISNIIGDFQKQLGSRIIPSEITKIPDFVNPSRHSYFTDKGKRYFFPNGSSEQVVENLKQEFLAKLKSGEFVSYDFNEVVEYEGRSVTFYKLTPSEVRTLALMFKAYGSKLVESLDDKGNKILKLVIGDYIYA